MPRGLKIRLACAPIALMLACAIALAPAGCGREKKESTQTKADPAASASNVRIKRYAKAPDVELKALDGSTNMLSDFEGNVVILSFLATWNKDCAAQVAELNKLQAKLQRYRFSVIGVFTDKGSNETIRTFLEKNPAAFLAYYNGDEIVGDFGGVRRIPTTYVLLRDRSIYARELGFRTMRQLEVFTKRINAQRL